MTAESTPVVLVHGFLDDGSIWSDVESHLKAAGVDVHTPSYCWRPDTSSFSDFAGELIDGLPWDNADPIILVGHSMGAPIAELMARQLGARVAGLVFVCAIPMQGVQLPPDVAATLRGCGDDEQAQRFVRTQMSLGPAPATVDKLVTMGTRWPVDRVQATFDAWTAGDPAAALELPPDVPTFIINSDNPFADKEMLDVIDRRYPHATHAYLAGVGHWPHAESPQAVGELVEAFISDVLSSSRTPEADRS